MVNEHDEQLVKVADLVAIVEILNAFNYETDEDSCMGMSFFTGRINEDHFFATKWHLEAALKAHQDKGVESTDF